MTLEFKYTERGFARAEFVDRFDAQCSLQKSSIAFEAPCIWLGVDRSAQGQESLRMHLTQEMVRDLLPALTAFVETGELPEGEE